jgi:hypothetical protein
MQNLINQDNYLKGLEKTKKIQKLAAAQVFNQEFDRYKDKLSVDELFDVINLVKADKYNAALVMLYKANWRTDESDKNTVDTNGNNR